MGRAPMARNYKEARSLRPRAAGRKASRAPARIEGPDGWLTIGPRGAIGTEAYYQNPNSAVSAEVEPREGKEEL